MNNFRGREGQGVGGWVGEGRVGGTRVGMGMEGRGGQGRERQGVGGYVGEGRVGGDYPTNKTQVFDEI